MNQQGRVRGSQGKRSLSISRSIEAQPPAPFVLLQDFNGMAARLPGNVTMASGWMVRRWLRNYQQPVEHIPQGRGNEPNSLY